MSNEEIKEKMAAFIGRDGREYFKGVFERNGWAYVTDGRIALCLKTDSSVDTMPAEFPLDALNGLMALPKKVEKWFALNVNDFDFNDRMFTQKFKDESVANDKSYRERYEAVMCPCCGKTLFWDTWDCKLVEEAKKEEKHAIDPRDIEYPVCINFGSLMHENFGFGYLSMLHRAFGDDMRFALEETAEKNKLPMALMKLKDVPLYGVLMPVRMAEGGRIACSIQASEEDAGERSV